MSDLSQHTPPLFFVEPGALSSSQVFLTGDTLRHALSQRLKPGQAFRVVETPLAQIQTQISNPREPQPQGQAPGQIASHTEIIEAEVIEAGRKRLVGKIANRYWVKPPSYALHLFPAILKGDKFDLMIKKATELGVTSITPVVTARTIPRFSKNKADLRMDRWWKVARAAAEQAGRPVIARIRPIIDFKSLMSNTLPGKPLLALERREVTQNLVEAIGSAREISILVGPEGGFESYEVEQALEKGFCPITLGPYILRAETASIAACAIAVDCFSRNHTS